MTSSAPSSPFNRLTLRLINCLNECQKGSKVSWVMRSLKINFTSHFKIIKIKRWRLPGSVWFSSYIWYYSCNHQSPKIKHSFWIEKDRFTTHFLGTVYFTVDPTIGMTIGFRFDMGQQVRSNMQSKRRNITLLNIKTCY